MAAHVFSCLWKKAKFLRWNRSPRVEPFRGKNEGRPLRSCTKEAKQLKRKKLSAKEGTCLCHQLGPLSISEEELGWFFGDCCCTVGHTVASAVGYAGYSGRLHCRHKVRFSLQRPGYKQLGLLAGPVLFFVFCLLFWVNGWSWNTPAWWL